MGARNSKNTNENTFIQNSVASESLGWNDVNTDAYTERNIKKTKDGIEVIELDIDFQNTDTPDSEHLNNVFNKLDEIILSENIKKESNNTESSPFISSDLYKKIMNGGDNTSSPFISTEVYKKIMNGGASLDDSSSSSSSEFDDSSSSSSDFEEDSLRMISTPLDLLIPMIGKKKKRKKHRSKRGKKGSKKISSKKKNSKKKNSKKKSNRLVSTTSSYIPEAGYNFSMTSSDFKIRSENHGAVNINNLEESSELSYQRYNLDSVNTASVKSETPYNINSSSINTSDINLISVDSVNGRRYL